MVSTQTGRDWVMESFMAFSRRCQNTGRRRENELENKPNISLLKYDSQSEKAHDL